MDGGGLNDYWMVRNELSVRHELKIFCHRLHKMNMVHRQGFLIVCGGGRNKARSAISKLSVNRRRVTEWTSVPPDMQPKWEGMDMCSKTKDDLYYRSGNVTCKALIEAHRRGCGWTGAKRRVWIAIR
jgi:hypothetical protein